MDWHGMCKVSLDIFWNKTLWLLIAGMKKISFKWEKQGTHDKQHILKANDNQEGKN